MKNVVTTFFLISCSLLAHGQDFGWVIQQGGNDAEGVYQIAEDGFGNIYEIGSFWATVDFDPSASVFNLTSAGLTDNFIAKLDPSGNLLWAKKFGGTGFEGAVNIDLDASNNIYAGGQFQSTVDFDPSGAVYNLTSSGSDDVFIASYSEDGDLIWASRFGNTGTDWMEGLTESGGFVYATGYYQGTVDFDPGPGVYNLTSSGPDGAFILKLDVNGNFIWAKSISGTSSTVSFDIAVDDEGNVFTGGQFYGTCDFDPGSGVQNKTSFGFNSDAFLLKLNMNGNYQWVDVFTGNEDEWVKVVDIDNNGDVALGGAFRYTTDFNPGPGTYNLTSNGNYDMFAMKLSSSNGSLVWAVATGGSSNEQLLGLDVSSSGEYFLTGFYSTTVDFDPGSGSYPLSAAGVCDIFYQRLNSSGEFVEAFGLGTFLSTSVGNTIHTDDVGRITLAGAFEFTVDFDPGPGVANLTSNLTTPDCFVVQFNSCLPVQTNTNTTICEGDSVFAAGAYQTSAGVYNDYYLASNGCDSIVSLNLVVLPSAITEIDTSICEGDFFPFNGSNINEAGIYTANLTASNGCDSTVTLALEVFPISSIQLNEIICFGDTYFFNGTNLSDPGTYVASLSTSHGCDSIVTLTLEVLPVYSAEINDTICNGESVIFNGNEIDSAGSYTANYISVNGCDSIVTLNLDVIDINASLFQNDDSLIAVGSGTYQWIYCESGSAIAGATDAAFIPSVSGSYAVIVSFNECSDTTNCIVFIATGSHDLSRAPEILIYPNPVNKNLILQSETALQNVLIDVRNVLGETVLSHKFNSLQNATLNVDQLSPGLYLLKISSESINYSVTVIKQ